MLCRPRTLLLPLLLLLLLLLLAWATTAALLDGPLAGRAPQQQRLLLPQVRFAGSGGGGGAAWTARGGTAPPPPPRPPPPPPPPPPACSALRGTAGDRWLQLARYILATVDASSMRMLLVMVPPFCGENALRTQEQTQQVQVAACGAVSLKQVITAAYGIPDTMARPQGICRRESAANFAGPGCAAETKDIPASVHSRMCTLPKFGLQRSFELQRLPAPLPMTRCLLCLRRVSAASAAICQ
jgi:hypothetical protein